MDTDNDTEARAAEVARVMTRLFDHVALAGRPAFIAWTCDFDRDRGKTGHLLAAGVGLHDLAGAISAIAQSGVELAARHDMPALGAAFAAVVAALSDTTACTIDAIHDLRNIGD